MLNTNAPLRIRDFVDDLQPSIKTIKFGLTAYLPVLRSSKIPYDSADKCYGRSERTNTSHFLLAKKRCLHHTQIGDIEDQTHAHFLAVVATLAAIKRAFKFCLHISGNLLCNCAFCSAYRKSHWGGHQRKCLGGDLRTRLSLAMQASSTTCSALLE